VQITVFQNDIKILRLASVPAAIPNKAFNGIITIITGFLITFTRFDKIPTIAPGNGPHTAPTRIVPIESPKITIVVE
jgi:hypothetical protein